MIDTIYNRWFQDFNNFEKLNPIEIKIDANKILKGLERYQKTGCKYRM